MNRRNIIVLAAAVVLGLFAVFLVNAWFDSQEERQELASTEQPIAKVVVASQPLDFGSPITSANVRLVDWPQSSLPAGAFTSLDQIQTGSRVALRPIEIGEPVLAARVSGTDGRASIAANIPDDQRAVSIPVSEVTGVAGFVAPGDVVDIFLTRQIPGDGAGAEDKMTSVVMENVQVLGIDQLADEKQTDPKVAKTATVLTDLRGAQKLALAVQVGTLSLALRNVENQAVGATSVVTARDLGGQGMYIAARSAPSGRSAAPVSTPAAATRAPASAREAAVQMPSGPTMMIFRGVEGAQHEVTRYGAR